MPRASKATVARRGRSSRGRERSLPAEISQSSTANVLANPIPSNENNDSSSGVSSRHDNTGNSDTRSVAGSAGGDGLSVLSKGTSSGFKLASTIIPEYDGENMPVSMFIEHCKAAAEAVEPHEIKYLILLIRTKVTKNARKHVWGKTFSTLDAILKQLERSTPTNDYSQLLQNLTNIKRNPNEKIADYGSRIFDILSEIEVSLQHEYPEEVGKSMIAGMKQTAVKHFIRGLDMQTLSFLSDKAPRDLDHAIDLATRADVEAKCWHGIHRAENTKHSYPPGSSSMEKIRIVGNKQVAYLKSDSEAPGLSRGKPLTGIQCFFCKEHGHIKRECPKLNKMGTAKGRREMHCDYCKRDNHMEGSCYLKRKHEKEREVVISKQARKYTRNGGLNGKWNRSADATTVQTPQTRREPDTSSISTETVNLKSH